MGNSVMRSPSNNDANNNPNYTSNISWLGNTGGNLFGGDRGRRNIRPVREIIVSAKPPSPDPDTLKIRSIDSAIERNLILHHTDELEEVKRLIVRRGQEFSLILKLSREFRNKDDVISFEFKTGDLPSTPKGSLIVVPLDQEAHPSKSQWKAHINMKDDDAKTLTTSVQFPPDALIGKYTLSVLTSYKDAHDNYIMYKDPLPFYILFNPWCKDDTLFLDDEAELNEYILNESGYLWYGHSDSPAARPWSFSQFDGVVFQAVMYLLETMVKTSARGSAIMVSRVMSAAVNSQNDNGVVSGRWDGNYAPYTRPTRWTGSRAILKQFLDTKRPVKYGQCWVFSGVMTTVLRCLGIPARSVTNYSSAHDTDVSMTIDKYFRFDGEMADEHNSDSVWNFHVWNEGFMTRPDLPAGYGGWQCLDSTPQETSEGIYCTGPCPVIAIKQGRVFYPNDTKFVFAEVNADIIHWQVQPDGRTMKLIKIKRSGVGKKISTKALNGRIRMDITDTYKHPEGSDAERAAVKSAVEYGTKPNVYDIPGEKDDVIFNIQPQKLIIGQHFDIAVPVTNQSNENRSVSVVVVIRVCYYTGVLADRIKKEEQELVVGPKSTTLVKFHVDPDEYLPKLVDQSAFKVFLLGTVKETGQSVADEEDFRLQTPDLGLQLLEPKSDEIHVNTEVTIEINLENPLKKNLTKCEFDVEGPGLQTPVKIKHGTISAGGTVTMSFKFKPTKIGKRILVVTFDSEELSQVTGELEVVVSKP